MRNRLLSVLLLTIISTSMAIAGGERFKPYILASVSPSEVEAKLTTAGFKIAGTYEPYEGARLITITSPGLMAEAAKSERGAYGAVLRVAITGDTVSYTAPRYWAHAYRLASDLGDVAVVLEGALGNTGTFGSEKGLKEKDLRKYHYMAMMPHFDDPVTLGSFDSYEAALTALDKGLVAKSESVKQVYRVALEGKEACIIGIGMVGQEDGADGVIMPVLNGFTGEPLHTAFLPYEILISGGDVTMLHGKFRIALSFPDLSMGQFMKIRNAPSAIKDIAKSLIE